MGREVYVAMLDNDWTNCITGFESRVIDLQRLCANKIDATGNDRNPLHVVLAPEYTFRKNPAQVVRKASKTYHGATRTPEAAFEAFADSREKSTLYSPREKELLLFHMCAITRGKNVLVIPGTMFWEESEPLFQTSKVLKRKTLVRKGVARNTTFVVYRGELLMEYHKQIDSHEFDSFEQEFYDFRGGELPATFDLNGISAGLEICADHSSGRNLRSAQVAMHNHNMTNTERFVHNKLSTPHGDGSQTEFGLDLQLVVSDGMPITPQTLAIRKGGFVAHCDTRLPKSVQTRAPTGGFSDVVPRGENHWKLQYGVSAAFADAKARLAQNLQFPR